MLLHIAAVAVTPFAAVTTVRGTGIVSTFASFGLGSGHVRATRFVLLYKPAALVAAVLAVYRDVAGLVA